MPDYRLFGYDKDGDVYEELFSGSLPRVKETASILVRHHAKTNAIRRSDNGEPFDWFVVRNAHDQDVMLFSDKNPGGLGLMEEPEKKSDETKFEELKHALFDHGPAAVEEFLGYEIGRALTENEIYGLMDDVWLQMPWEELREFYEKYGIDLL